MLNTRIQLIWGHSQVDILFNAYIHHPTTPPSQALEHFKISQEKMKTTLFPQLYKQTRNPQKKSQWTPKKFKMAAKMFIIKFQGVQKKIYQKTKTTLFHSFMNRPGIRKISQWPPKKFKMVARMFSIEFQGVKKKFYQKMKTTLFPQLYQQTRNPQKIFKIAANKIQNGRQNVYN